MASEYPIPAPKEHADVFPLRWENGKSGKSGYAPACANEWVRGVCNKPQVKCGECQNQAFIAVSDSVIARHLRGEDSQRSDGAGFVAGVYPVLLDGNCWFVTADFDGEHWAADALAGLPALDFGGVRGTKKREYIAAIHAALARDYTPMTAVFHAVIRRTLRSVAKTSSE
jgi:hypothetical protein